ncbi:MAG: electron transfer flavoprotein-ubiquinone oxidoreductase [Calditrichaeota bacterium]|nr:electron transfer flavoprotein-ubiquinone oxidoreductase [Calditrichota bacterium]MCB9368008.1 electron transfer flavoprotein-ubiquinone oxidoreductase [Calditrichota bacterium]
MERETLPVDVLIVGAGPAGLSCAYHLKQMIKRANAAGNGPGEIEIMVIEKSRELGAHNLSGAVMDPRSIKELVPDWKERDFPVERTVEEEGVYYLTSSGKMKAPWTPPPLQNHGYPIVSINRLSKWLGELCEAEEILIATETPGQHLLYDGNRVVGVQTGDKGINKNGEQKGSFEPGANIEARVTVLTEGTRGSLTKEACNKLNLHGEMPQTYVLGVKEVWELPKSLSTRGSVIHTMGYPLGDLFGGSWIYSMRDNMISIGLVTDLGYKNPYTDPHYNFQKFKEHPWIKEILRGGKMLGYGAKTIPEGGWFSMPKLYADGLLLAGDSAAFLNAQRLKGIHLAMKSGMLAAESIFAALKKDDTTAATLSMYKEAVDASWIKDELWSVRNFHQGFESGLFAGMINAGAQFFTGGRGFTSKILSPETHTHMRKIKDLNLRNRDEVLAERLKEHDREVTFDKLSDVYKSKTLHEEDQPVHLHVADTEICRTKCREEYGNPCEFFCPANVYEMVADEERGGVKLQINASNCVHCKTCDIMDPYQIITWVPPEGGGGPEYTDL